MNAQSSPAAVAAVAADNLRFSHYVLIVLSAIVVSFFIYRIANDSMRHLRTLTCLNNETQRYFKTPNRIFGFIKRHLFYAPLFKKRHSRPMRAGPIDLGALPTRLQGLLIVGVIAMNVVLCVYGIEWHGPIATKLTHFRNRSGTLAVVNLIPLVIMAGRNNPLIWLLNVPYDTFNLMHRWFGRIVVSLVITHATVEIINMIVSGTMGQGPHPSGFAIFQQTLANARFITFGFVAFVAFIVIILTSHAAFRHAFYETFWHIHVALVSLILAALWVHLQGLTQLNYIKAVIALWVVERVQRLIVLLYRNLGPTNTRANIELLPGDALRVTLSLAHPWNFQPGQHIFLTIPSIGLYTAHPFSLAWSETSPHLTPSPSPDLEKATLNTDILSLPQTSLSLIIRRRSGFTNHLYTKCAAAPATRLSLPALVEGPYGGSHDFSSYGTIMLFAGGVGITHQLPFIRSLLAAYASNTVAARKVTLIWVIQSPEHLEWIRPWMTTILAMPKRRDLLRIQLFVTRPRNSNEIHSPSATVQMFPGKPNVERLVEMECREQVGAMGVGVCGPGGLGDDVREAVRKRCMGREVDLLEEGFGW